MAAFARECGRLTKWPVVKVGLHSYDGHVVRLWDDRLVPEYGPYDYGIGHNECGNVIIVSVSDGRRTQQQ